MIADADYVPTPEQVAAVVGFLATFERSDFVPAQESASGHLFDQYIWHAELDAFHQAVYHNGFVSRFDWPSWQETALRYIEEPSLLADVDIQVIRKLITVHVRKERFCDGHLPAMITNGHMAAVLRRLDELRFEAERRPAGT